MAEVSSSYVGEYNIELGSSRSKTTRSHRSDAGRIPIDGHEDINRSPPFATAYRKVRRQSTMSEEDAEQFAEIRRERATLDSIYSYTTKACFKHIKSTKYIHIFVRLFFVVFSILVMYFWISEARDGYATSDAYFGDLQNNVKAPSGTPSMTAALVMETMMGEEFVLRYSETFAVLVVISAKDETNRFMEDPTIARSGPVGQFMDTIARAHQNCESVDVELAMNCTSCTARIMSPDISNVMDECGNGNDVDIRRRWEDVRVVESEDESMSWESQHLWYDYYESVESYFHSHETLGESEARRRFVGADGTATIIRMIPRKWYMNNFKDRYVHFLETQIDAFFPLDTSPYHAEIVSWPLLAKGASEGFQDDLASGDFLVLPLSWFILLWICGPNAIVVLVTLPLSVLTTIKYVQKAHEEEDYKFPAFSVSLWLVLEVALAIDYALFLLSRFKEEFESRRHARRTGSRRRLRSGATNDTVCTEVSTRVKLENCATYADDLYADGMGAFKKTLLTAGETIGLSGLTLAGSFVGMIFVEDHNVKAVGLSCVIATVVTVACNLTVIPSVITLTLPVQPFIDVVNLKFRAFRRQCCARCLEYVRSRVPLVFRGSGRNVVHAPLSTTPSRVRTISMQPIMSYVDDDDDDDDTHLQSRHDRGSSKSPRRRTKREKRKKTRRGDFVALDDLDLEEEEENCDDDVSKDVTTGGAALTIDEDAVKDDPSALSSAPGFWRKLGRFCKNHPWVAILVVVGCSLPFVACLGVFSTSISFMMLLPTTNPTYHAMHLMADQNIPSSFHTVIGLVTTPVGTAIHRESYDDEYVTNYAAGGWGGSCTCPSGKTYLVGDRGDACASLACNGGLSGSCKKEGGAWSHKEVTCGTYQSKAASRLIADGKTCASPQESLGSYRSIHDCAYACASVTGCRYFTFETGKDETAKKECFEEKTTSPDCPEGWIEDDSFNVFEIVATNCTDRDDIVATVAGVAGLADVSSCQDARPFCSIAKVNQLCGCTCHDVIPHDSSDGFCYDDDATVSVLSERLNMPFSATSCADIETFCGNELVASTCSCTCKNYVPLPPGVGPDGKCLDNNADAITYASFMGIEITGCADALPYCSIDLVSATCGCTCADQSGGGGLGSCEDSNHAAVAFAEQQGMTIEGCQDISGFCAFAQVQLTCPRTCGLCLGASLVCEDSNELLRQTASAIGVGNVKGCPDAVYFCSKPEIAALCPETCLACPGDKKPAKYGAVLTRRHFADVTDAVESILSVDDRFHPMDVDAVSWFQGHSISVEWAIEALFSADADNATAKQRNYRDMFRKLQNGPMPLAIQRGLFFGTDMTISAVRVRTPWNAMGGEYEDWMGNVRDATRSIRDDESGVNIYFASALAFQLDDRSLIYASAPLIMLATVVVMVVVFSACAFHSLVLGPRLLLTIVITLSSTYGACAIWFDILKMGSGGDGVYWLAPIVCTPILVGLTLDYDLFLIGRVYEYRKMGYSTSDATILGLEKTGGIITTAGTIMLTAFFALLISSNPVVAQLGFILSFSVFVDTFVVRSIFVPAVMQVGVEWNWWPKKMPAVSRVLSDA